jgi:hypothetical protein
MFLIVRTAEAHAHLCADGKEPPVTIHLADGGSHPCVSGSSSGHHGDKDVQLAPDVALKKPPATDVWILSALPLLYQFSVATSETRIDCESLVVCDETASYLRPPLRGPPL